MNKKRYLLLTLLLSSTAYQITCAIRVPYKTLLVLGASAGLFTAEVSKTKEKNSHTPASEKTVLAKTHPYADATLQTASQLLYTGAIGLIKGVRKLTTAASYLEETRETLPQTIEAFGKKIGASVTLSESTTISTTPAITEVSQPASVLEIEVIPTAPTTKQTSQEVISSEPAQETNE